MVSETSDDLFECRICGREIPGKMSLVQHLRLEHDVLELANYGAITMVLEQRRDSLAVGLHRLFTAQRSKR